MDTPIAQARARRQNIVDKLRSMAATGKIAPARILWTTPTTIVSRNWLMNLLSNRTFRSSGRSTTFPQSCNCTSDTQPPHPARALNPWPHNSYSQPDTAGLILWLIHGKTLWTTSLAAFDLFLAAIPTQSVPAEAAQRYQGVTASWLSAALKQSRKPESIAARWPISPFLSTDWIPHFGVNQGDSVHNQDGDIFVNNRLSDHQNCPNRRQSASASCGQYAVEALNNR